MKVVTYTQARQSLSKLLVLAQKEEVEIRGKDGVSFSLRAKPRKPGSPFDVPPIKTAVKRSDILDAVRVSRARPTP